MKPLSVRRIWGIGQVSAKKLELLGVTTCGQLQRYSRVELHRVFGKFGLELFELCRGIDDRPVLPHRERKSQSTEHTYSENLTSLEACEKKLKGLHAELLEDLKSSRSAGRVRKIFVKLRFADFSRTTAECVSGEPVLERYMELLEQAYRRKCQSIRLMGVGVRFTPEAEESRQLELSL